MVMLRILMGRRMLFLSSIVLLYLFVLSCKLFRLSPLVDTPVEN